MDGAAEMNIYLKEQISPRISNGHPWIYENEIAHSTGALDPMGIADVFTHSKQFIGRGYYNPRSKIPVRLLTRRFEEIDESFLRRTIQKALAYREKLPMMQECCRLFFGESDGIGGLIIDRYGDVAVIQANTLWVDQMKPAIVKALVDFLHPKAILEKSDHSSRRKEGLTTEIGWLFNSVSLPFQISLEGLVWELDLIQAQKTGLYLDQKENALIASRAVYPEGKSVLDAFCHTGNFGLRMLQAGASDVTFVDQADNVLQTLQKNVRLNGFEEQTYFHGNAFDLLREWDRSGKKWDVICLDPPSFTKSRSSRSNALRGYKEVNVRGLKLLRSGGYLVTSSCSQAVSREEFEMMIYSCISDLKIGLKLIHRGGQSQDHPIRMEIFETDYLKFYIFQKSD